MDASTELIEYYKKLVNNNSSVIIGGNLTKAEEYMFISNSKVSLSDIMCVAKPEYSGNYNTDENKNNHQYKKTI